MDINIENELFRKLGEVNRLILCQIERNVCVGGMVMFLF